MKIYRKEDKIIFEEDFFQKRSNPYMEGEDVGSYPTYVGLLYKDRWGNDKIGFAHVIDMDYKDKSDQWTDIVIEYQGIEKDFKKLCEDLKIGYVDERLSDRNVNFQED